MPSTPFKLPTAVRRLPQGGATNMWANINNVLVDDGNYATCTLPNGNTYSPTPAEIAAGYLLPEGLFINKFDFASDMPANAIVTGITVRTKFYSEAEYDAINYYFQFANNLDVVFELYDNYFLFQPKIVDALVPTTQRDIGGTTDNWQPENALYKDGMYLYYAGEANGLGVFTSTVDPTSYDVNIGFGAAILQPTTQGYNGASLDTIGAILDYTGLVGKTITVHTPFDGDIVFTGQAGAVTPGDETFQAATSNDATAESITAQFNSHPVVGNIIFGSFFPDIQWVWQTYDVGSYLNALQFTTDADPSVLLFPNDGQFSGGTDPDPNVSTMNSITASAAMNAGGIGCKAYSPDGDSVPVPIDNVITYFAPITSEPASKFRNNNFGLIIYYDNFDTGGQGIDQYPPIDDDIQRLYATSVSLTYTVTASGGGGSLLLGV